MTDRPAPERERRAAPRPRRLWERVRDNVRFLQRRMEQEGERLRVNEVLGYRVSRPVLSPDGPIAAAGDRVSPSVVDRARSSGVLPALLEAAEPVDRENDTNN